MFPACVPYLLNMSEVRLPKAVVPLLFSVRLTSHLLLSDVCELAVVACAALTWLPSTLALSSTILVPDPKLMAGLKLHVTI